MPVSTPSFPSFAENVRSRAHAIQSWLCVGLDPTLEKLPAGVARTATGVCEFCLAVARATASDAVAFKINLAFFEALGREGWDALYQVRTNLPSGVPVIGDAKRGDMDNTSAAYATALFDQLGFDAVTVSPYLGWDALSPFLSYAGHGVFVLCKTSNPGAGALQDLAVDGEPLYVHVGRGALATPAQADVGLVIGATQPEALRRMRAESDHTLFLVPGVGAQGATASDAVREGANTAGDNALAAVSRHVMYASAGSDFEQAAHDAASNFARDTWQPHAVPGASH